MPQEAYENGFIKCLKWNHKNVGHNISSSTIRVEMNLRQALLQIALMQAVHEPLVPQVLHSKALGKAKALKYKSLHCSTYRKGIMDIKCKGQM